MLLRTILTTHTSLKASLKITKAKRIFTTTFLPAQNLAISFSSGKRRQRDCAKSFVGNEPFAVLYGDDVIISDNPVTKQLCDAYEKYGKGCVGVKEVPKKDVPKYCSLAVEKIEGNCFNCTDMIEKPKPEQIMSNYSILGRVVLPPEIFDILEKTPLGAGNELQLTDAMKTLAQNQGVIAVDYEGKRYDMGNKFGILQANIEVGLKHPDTRDELKAYLKELAKNF